MTTGIITAIHRNSVVDGPGLRTTVFLKGCPLRCVWCHNPETQNPRIELSFDRDKCSGCAACAAACSRSAVSMVDDRAEIDRARCGITGDCTAVCPETALTFYGCKAGAGEIFALVCKDRDYYEASGGGVTISGGEPLMQKAFTLDLLRRLRSAGIHTALDTTGFASREVLASTLPFTSLYLFDYKATGSDLHRSLTGVPSTTILRSLSFLMDRGAPVRLRCPVIPGLNDTSEHLEAIAGMEHSLPSLLGIDILTWHTMGRAKASRLGRPPAPGLPEKNTSDDTREKYRTFFASRNCGKIAVM